MSVSHGLGEIFIRGSFLISNEDWGLTRANPFQKAAAFSPFRMCLDWTISHEYLFLWDAFLPRP